MQDTPIPPFVIKATAAACLGGILFGYDLGVISAALPKLTETFALKENQQDMVVSFLFIGCSFGALVGGNLCDKYGRKRMIIATDFVFLIGSTVLYFAPTFEIVLLGRILIGSAVAISGIADVAYLHEISPIEYRGSIVSCNEACISLGFLISYLVGYWFSLHVSNDSWRDMFALGSVIATIQMVAMHMMPESPVWLKEKGYTEKATTVLNLVYGTESCAKTHTNGFEVVQGKNGEYPNENDEDVPTPPALSLDKDQPVTEVEQSPESFSIETCRTFYRQIIIAIFLCTMQNLCGNTNILNFAPEIFGQIGFESEASVLICTSIVGVVKFGTVCFAIKKVDTYGRRYLLLLGMCMIATSLLILSIAYISFRHKEEKTSLEKICATAAVLGIAAGYSLSFGPLVWLIISELFPSGIRGRALGFGTICSYFSAFLVSYTFLTGQNVALFFPFMIYFALTVLGSILTYALIPDTGSKTEMEIHFELEQLWRSRYGILDA